MPKVANIPTIPIIMKNLAVVVNILYLLDTKYDYF